jgi:hypothetical protein
MAVKIQYCRTGVCMFHSTPQAKNRSREWNSTARPSAVHTSPAAPFVRRLSRSEPKCPDPEAAPSRRFGSVIICSAFTFGRADDTSLSYIFSGVRVRYECSIEIVNSEDGMCVLFRNGGKMQLNCTVCTSRSRQQ